MIRFAPLCSFLALALLTTAAPSRDLPTSPVELRNALDVRDFGAKFDGTSNDGPAINAAIEMAASRGGGAVLLPPGTAVISQIVVKSGISLIGSGERTTFLRCTETCITAEPGVQLVGLRLADMNLQPASTANDKATVIRFGSLGKSEIGRLLIEGFVNGTALSLGGVVPATLTDTNISGNVVWNTLHDITVFGCKVCAVLQGKYGTNTGIRSDAPSPIPNGQVVTANKFDNINLYYVFGIGWDVRLAVDTNLWIGGLIELQGETSSAIMLGNDPAYTGNTYVNSNKFFGIAFTRDQNVKSAYQVIFGGKNFTFGNEAFGVESDIDINAPNFHVVDMPFAVNYRICGKQLDRKPEATQDFRLGCLEKGIAWQDQHVFEGLANGFSVRAGPNVNKIVLSGSGTLGTGTVSLPCSPPDGLRVTIASTALTVATQRVAACETAGTVAGESAALTPTTPQSYRYIARSQYWVRD